MVLGSRCRDPWDSIRYSLALVLVPSKGESMKRHFVTLLITIGFVTVAAHSQTPIGLEGKWEGTLVAGAHPPTHPRQNTTRARRAPLLPAQQSEPNMCVLTQH